MEFLARTVALPAPSPPADLDTGLIERNRAELLPPRRRAADEVLAAAALAELLAEQTQARASARPPRAIRTRPGIACDGWRLNQDSHHDFVFAEGERAHAVTVHFRAAGLQLGVAGREFAARGRAARRRRAAGAARRPRSFQARAVRDGARLAPVPRRHAPAC